MADVKWIKITTDIFDDDKILLIESLPDAYAIIVVWFKLLCLAGKMNNSGVFILGDKIAYTDKMLSTIFRMKESTVQLALQTFEQFGMIEIVDGIITIPNWGKHQSIDKIEARNEYQKNYMRMYRDKQKLLCKTNSKTNSKVNVSGTEEDKNRIDKNIYNIHPTVDEVAAYVAEKGYHFDAEAFVAFYESKGWKIGKEPMKNWKACCATWEKRHAEQKQKNGFHNFAERAGQDLDSGVMDEFNKLMGD